MPLIHRDKTTGALEVRLKFFSNDQKTVSISKNTEDRMQRGIVAIAYASVSAFILYNFYTNGIAPEIFILTATVLALGGLYIGDYFNRRRWENDIAAEINDLKERQDNVARHVARSHNEIRAIKSGLSQAVKAVRDEGARFQAPASIEGRMLDVLVAKLGTLGSVPKSLFASFQTKANIAELKSTPPKDSAPPSSDLDRALMPDFDNFSSNLKRKLVTRAIEGENFGLFLQPIVNLPQRKTVMYEVLTRVRTGSGAWLPARYYMDMLRQDSQVTMMDHCILMQTLALLKGQQATEKTGDKTPYCLNIAGSTLQNGRFMQKLVSTLSQDRALARRLVFELPLADLQGLSDRVQELIRALVTLGCRFSVDQVQQKKIDIDILKRCKIRFIKTNATWLHEESRMPQGHTRLARFKRELDNAGIDMIAEKVENEDVIRDLMDFNIGFGQGYLFAKPDRPLALSPARLSA